MFLRGKVVIILAIEKRLSREKSKAGGQLL